MAWYNAGTIAVVAGSKTVTGTGTQFLSNVNRGGILVIGTELWIINDVKSDFELELREVFTGPTASGMTYEIILDWVNPDPDGLARRIDDFLTDRQRTMDEFVRWVNGKYNDGPTKDGKYPLTDRYGVVTLVKSPERMQYEAGGGTGGGGGGADLGGLGIILASDFGVLGGGTIDETDNINAALVAAQNQGGGEVVVRSKNGTDKIYINGLIAIESNNTKLTFVSDINYGPKGWMRISGGLAEIRRPGQIELLKLRLPSYANADGYMVLPMREGNGSFLKVGDRITIRGENDKNGRVIDKQITIVTAINGDDAICADEPDYTFQPVYPDSEFEDDHTTGTTISISVYSAMTANCKNTDIIPVVDTTGFFPGDLVYISDSRTEKDMMAPVVTNLLSAANMEIMRIAAVEGNNLRMERAIRREYLTAWAGGVVKMDAIQNSHIKLKNVYWVGIQPDRKAHGMAINYGANCTTRVDNMYGRGGRKGIGIRIAYSYDCHAIESKVYDAYSFASAEGYGISLYYSTLCSVRNCQTAGNRHNILLQTATSCDVLDNVSNDDYISGIDLHGAGSVDCRIMRNRLSRSKSYADGVTNGGAIRNGNTAHTIGDHNTLIADNYIEGYLDTKCAAIDVSPSSNGVIVRNNDIVDCQVGFRHYKIGSAISPSQFSDRVILDGNTYTRVAQIYDVDNYANSFINELVCINEKSVDNIQHFVIKKIPKVLMMNCKIIAPRKTPGVHAFDITGVASLKMYDNYAGEAARGIRVTSCAVAKIVRNLLGDVYENIGVVDGGGNGQLINLQNTDEVVGGGGGSSGGGVKCQRVLGTLAADTSSTETVSLNNSTPVITAGLTAMQASIPVTVGSFVEITAVIPYVSMGGSSGACVAHLWADGVRIATAVKRLTASGGGINSGGEDFVLIGSVTASEPILDLILKIGASDTANNVMLNNKLNGSTQPYMMIKEFLA
ncbi:tail fiber protein [Pseudomonas phage hairong]|nr:tail fiber protein [Pseudomonas phage hairong]